MVRRDPARDITENFLATVGTWIDEQGEVLVVLQYVGAAGSKDYTFCKTPAEFRSLCHGERPGTYVTVFRQPQLPLRGTVTESFIRSAVDCLPDGTEYMAVLLEPLPAVRFEPTGRMGETHCNLRDDLSGWTGRSVAVGRCPQYWGPDNEDTISAAKDGILGPL